MFFLFINFHERFYILFILLNFFIVILLSFITCYSLRVYNCSLKFGKNLDIVSSNSFSAIASTSRFPPTLTAQSYVKFSFERQLNNFWTAQLFQKLFSGMCCHRPTFMFILWQIEFFTKTWPFRNVHSMLLVFRKISVTSYLATLFYLFLILIF